MHAWEKILRDVRDDRKEKVESWRTRSNLTCVVFSLAICACAGRNENVRARRTRVGSISQRKLHRTLQ